MLVGRDREVDAIVAAIDRAKRGERAAVMFTGEPGIGKSRLLDELASRVTALGGVAAWGRSAEVGLTPAFWPWSQLLATLGDAELLDLATDDQPAAATSRLVKFEQVVQVLRARTQTLPLIALLFDDAHAADLASLQLLEYALPRLAGKLVFAISARDADATDPVQAMLGRIQRATRRLPLARLGRDDVARLVGDRLATGAIARVWELTEGNPLFVEELVSTLVDGGAGVQLPAVSSVRAIIRDRIDHMPPESGAVLVAASLLGREFRVAVVADLLGVAEGEVVARLAPAQRLGMVRAMTGDRYRFSHALIAEALADELAPPERARLHLRAAQAIERKAGGEPSAVAHHLLAAGHLAAEAAVVAAERAATDAMTRLAFEDAAAVLERAASALALAAPGDRARRAKLEGRWAEALQHAGDHARASELCDSAIDIARALGDPELRARIAVVRGLEFRFGRTDPLLVAILQDALSALGDLATPERTVLRAKLLARLAAAKQPALDPQTPVREALAAIELASTISDRDRLEVCHVACAALIEYVPAERLEPILHDNLALATAANDRVTIVHTMTRLCFAALERLDRSAFDQLRRDLRARAHALGIARWIRTVHLIDAAAGLLDGRFADAERAADAAETASAQDPDGRWLVDAHRLMSTFIRAVPIGPELREFANNFEPARAVFLTWIAAEDGDLDEIQRTLAHATTTSPDPELVVMLANALAIAGTTEHRSRIYDLAVARTGRMFFTTMVGTAVIDLYDRAALVLAASLERWDKIEAHAADALAVADKLGSVVWATRIRADFADALEARATAKPPRAATDRTRAAELRGVALRDAERFGMPRIIARCRGARSPVPSAGPRPHGSRVELDRQGGLWTIRGFGEEAHLKDSRGLQMLARLLERPRDELHVLDLSGVGGVVDGGDAGEVLDAAARAAYRERLRELTEQRDEAEAWGDLGRFEKTTEELEALSEELGRAVGLGGRARRQGSASERARSNVQRRLNHALQVIRTSCPRIGEHLAATVHTGTYCRYEPLS